MDQRRDQFEQLLRQHLDWVYSSARRRVRDAALADDVTQATFILLWQKLPHLPADHRITGWLYRTVRYCASNALRLQQIRQKHEREAAMSRLQIDTDSTTLPNDLADQLEPALDHLSTADRTALLLRFYRNLSIAEVGTTLGISEEAAKKRLQRALDRLRELLASRGRGLTMTSSALGAALLTHCIPAPPALSTAILTTITTQAAGSSACLIASHTAKALLWTKAKIAAAVLLTTGLTGGVFLAQQNGASAAPATQIAAPASAPAPATPATAQALANLPPQERRIYELIYQLRTSTPPQRPEEWITPLREITQIGKPAVPALVAELDQATSDKQQRLLLMALRIIKDPRAVPAMIRSIPRLTLVSSDYGFTVEDTELRNWLDSHFWAGKRDPRDRMSNFNRGITECFAGLEAITRHTEGRDVLTSGIVRDTPAQRGQATNRHQAFAARWQRWWDAHQHEFLTPADLATVEGPKPASDLIEAAGLARFGPLFPTGPQIHLSPVRELLVPTQGHWDAACFIDFDTGRAYALQEGLSSPTQEQSNRWMWAAGVDAYSGTTYWRRGNDLDDPFCTLDTCDLSTWPIENERFDRIEEEILSPKPLDLGRWGPSGNLVARDPKTGELRHRLLPATFLFNTREGGRGILQIVASEQDGSAVRIRYRTYEGLPTRQPPLASALAATQPATAPTQFGPTRELTLVAPALQAESAVDLDTGTVRAQEVDTDDPRFTEAKYKWINAWGGDIFTYIAQGGKLAGLACSGTTAMSVSPAAWDQTTPAQLPLFLARREPRTMLPMGDIMSIDPLRKTTPTWLVKTREGAMGILQITRIDHDELTIRYKLVQVP